MSARKTTKLEARELAMLAHALRLIPSNACLTGRSATFQGGSGILFFHEAQAFKSLWEKVAREVTERADMAPFRVSK